MTSHPLLRRQCAGISMVSFYSASVSSAVDDSGCGPFRWTFAAADDDSPPCCLCWFAFLCFIFVFIADDEIWFRFVPCGRGATTTVLYYGVHV